MFWEIKQIAYRDITEFIPAFIMIFSMPLTMSIYNGFAYGFISYAFIKLIFGKAREVHGLIWVLSLLFLTHKIIENTL